MLSPREMTICTDLLELRMPPASSKCSIMAPPTTFLSFNVSNNKARNVRFASLLLLWNIRPEGVHSQRCKRTLDDKGYLAIAVRSGAICTAMALDSVPESNH